mgnify:FL=1
MRPSAIEKIFRTMRTHAPGGSVDFVSRGVAMLFEQLFLSQSCNEIDWYLRYTSYKIDNLWAKYMPSTKKKIRAYLL